MQPQPNPKKSVSNPPPLEIGNAALIATQTPTPPNFIRERIIAHTIEVKSINNRYTTSLSIESGSSESKSTVNILVKHSKLFAAIKIIDPSTTFTLGEKTFNHPGELPKGTEYTKSFKVITDKKQRFPRFFVLREITSKFTIAALKYGNHNVRATL